MRGKLEMTYRKELRAGMDLAEPDLCGEISALSALACEV
jgi:hypothetical protein